MKLHLFILVDLLALAFAAATLWLMYLSMQRSHDEVTVQHDPYAGGFDDDFDGLYNEKSAQL
eukprot:m.111392 g.111392  ORF g.111392 m.111392 type:complete len:62 (-) comp15382_c0_seq2:3320-3505(-)